jgi:tripartite-type tricarboxylate transporter receptor subunit TctC
MKKLTLIVVTTVVALIGGALYAEDYPARPITFIAVFGPGSASDTGGRLYAPDGDQLAAFR